MDEFLCYPAGRIIDWFHLTPEQMTLRDEPPGKLPRVFISCSRGRRICRIWVGLKYNRQTMFSLNRKWPFQVIREAIVDYYADSPWWLAKPHDAAPSE